MSLLKYKIKHETDIMPAIKKIMTTVLTKDVELLYSGTGKAINGKRKRDFSATYVYKCLHGNNN